MATTKSKKARRAPSKNKKKGRKAGRGWYWVLGAAAVILLVQVGTLLQKASSSHAFPMQKMLSFKGDNQDCGPFQVWAVGQVDGKTLAVTDQGKNRVLLFDLNGRFLREIEQKEAGEPKFNELSGLTSDPKGNLYVMDAWNSLIRGFDPKGKSILKARIDNTYGPRGLEYYQGDFLIADTGVHRIAKVSSNGTILGSWGRKGTGRAEFSDPLDVRSGPDGNLFVADSNNHRIEVLDPSGKFLKSLDMDSIVNSLALDKDGRVFATNQEQGTITVFGKNGKSMGKVTDVSAKNPVALDGFKGLAFLPDGSLVAGHRDEVWILRPAVP